MDIPFYFPILRAKSGEIEAIGQLSPNTQSRTRPLFDFPAPAGTEGHELEQFLINKIGEIGKGWDKSYEICLDFSRYEPGAKLPDGQPIVDFAFEVSRQWHLKSVPVIAPLSPSGSETRDIKAVHRVAARDGRGVALRLSHEHFSTTARLLRDLRETANLVSVATQEIDLYLDAGSLAVVPMEFRQRDSLAGILQRASDAALSLGCRRVIFAASSVPDSMTRHRKGEVLQVSRIEFQAWRSLLLDLGSRAVLFGDYGVIDPNQMDSGAPRSPPARVRITSEDEYLLYKGDSSEIRNISKRAIQDGALNGSTESWGANAVRACAAGSGGAGSATTWIARDTNMHIENTVAAIGRYVVPESGSLPESQMASTVPWLQNVLSFMDE